MDDVNANDDMAKPRGFWRTAALKVTDNFWLVSLFGLVALLVFGAIDNQKTQKAHFKDMMQCLDGNLLTCAACAAYDDSTGAACRQALYRKATQAKL